jgi:hypothetical protein
MATLDPVGAVGALTGAIALFFTWRESRRRRRREAFEEVAQQAQRLFVYAKQYVDSHLIGEGPPKLYGHGGVEIEVVNSSQAPIFFLTLQHGNTSMLGPWYLNPQARVSQIIQRPDTHNELDIPVVSMQFTDASWRLWERFSTGRLTLLRDVPTYPLRNTHKGILVKRLLFSLLPNPQSPYIDASDEWDKGGPTLNP